MSLEKSEKIGILWDLDGTIVDSIDLYYASYKPVFQKYGIPEPPEAEFYHDYRTKYFGRSVEALICDYSPRVFAADEMAALKRDYLMCADRMIRERGMDCVRTLAGVERVLNGFYERGCPMAIASTSWMPTIVHTLETIGFLDKFVNIISGNILPSKPAPAVFLTAAASIGMPAERCVVFEDSLGGMRGAKNAGMMCVGIAGSLTPDKMIDADLPLACYADLDLDALIAKVNGLS